MTELYGGVETGGTWCVCALGSGPERLEAREQFRTGSPAETLDAIVEFFASRPRPVAVGIGAFGPLDLDEDSPTWGHVTTTPKPAWQHAPLAPTLRARLGLPVAFDTDVGAAALAEFRWGAGLGVKSLCYLTAGTGIGAGLVQRGRIWHGLVHPEVGHLRVPHDRGRDPFPGSCPVHGDCWEGLAAGGALEGRWGSRPDELPDDHPAWELEADYLALGILAILSVASPHRIVVGGGIFERAGVLAGVRRRVPALLGGYLESPLLGPHIDEYLVAPALGDDAGVLGAIALASDLIDGAQSSGTRAHTR
jgi:fructokinase